MGSRASNPIESEIGDFQGVMNLHHTHLSCYNGRFLFVPLSIPRKGTNINEKKVGRVMCECRSLPLRPYLQQISINVLLFFGSSSRQVG